MDSIKRYYRTERENIAFIRFIFEGYDGIASVTTLDSSKGEIVLYIPPGCLKYVEAVLKDIGRDRKIEPIEKAEGL